MSHPRTMSLRTRDCGSRGNLEAAHSWWCCHVQDFSARNSHLIVGHFIYWAISPQSSNFLVHEIICLVYCWSHFELCFLLLSVEGHTALWLIWKSMCAPICRVSVFQVCFQVRAHGILYSEWPRLIYPIKKGGGELVPLLVHWGKQLLLPPKCFPVISIIFYHMDKFEPGVRGRKKREAELYPLLILRLLYTWRLSCLLLPSLTSWIFLLLKSFKSHLVQEMWMHSNFTSLWSVAPLESE